MSENLIESCITYALSIILIILMSRSPLQHLVMSAHYRIKTCDLDQTRNVPTAKFSLLLLVFYSDLKYMEVMKIV